MFIYHKDKTITIKCSDEKFRTYVLDEKEFLEYIKTGEFDYERHIEVDSSIM
ncbi:MAG: hypothetical protein UU66_C0012G0016 [Parcubacteria group bacterium GW2011_GWB1_41_5]|nr:MAG: hypothetical protein UU01_C0002G0062 [Parcubacteria group bacterium GW2011_GWA2_40_37]KKS11682.1 MAG: hypothetical protein UU66_C0012G0016 [Parcubacteria group bacterium GW2011_GWB1_41_5]